MHSKMNLFARGLMQFAIVIYTRSQTGRTISTTLSGRPTDGVSRLAGEIHPGWLTLNLPRQMTHTRHNFVAAARNTLFSRGNHCVSPRVLTKSPKVVHQNSSVSERTSDGWTTRQERKRESWEEGGKRDRKKPALRGAELATRQSQELAGKNPPSPSPRLKKELAKRSLRLMCREEARA